MGPKSKVACTPSSLPPPPSHYCIMALQNNFRYLFHFPIGMLAGASSVVLMITAQAPKIVSGTWEGLIYHQENTVLENKHHQ